MNIAMQTMYHSGFVTFERQLFGESITGWVSTLMMLKIIWATLYVHNYDKQ